eukprot:scaffold52700_cov31-Tisochrysis_lutea.AAC.3
MQSVEKLCWYASDLVVVSSQQETTCVAARADAILQHLAGDADASAHYVKYQASCAMSRSSSLRLGRALLFRFVEMLQCKRLENAEQDELGNENRNRHARHVRLKAICDQARNTHKTFAGVRRLKTRTTMFARAWNSAQTCRIHWSMTNWPERG